MRDGFGMEGDEVVRAYCQSQKTTSTFECGADECASLKTRLQIGRRGGALSTSVAELVMHGLAQAAKSPARARVTAPHPSPRPRGRSLCARRPHEAQARGGTVPTEHD